MSRGPVKSRKTPIRHRVKEHKRLGRPVHSYMRGHGDKAKLGRRTRRSGASAPTPVSRSVGRGGNPRGNPGHGRVVGNPTNPLGTAYDVRIFYTDFRSERFSVDAKDYPSALTGGLEQRDTIEPPKLVRMRRGVK